MSEPRPTFTASDVLYAIREGDVDRSLQSIRGAVNTRLSVLRVNFSKSELERMRITLPPEGQ